MNLDFNLKRFFKDFKNKKFESSKQIPEELCKNDGISIE